MARSCSRTWLLSLLVTSFALFAGCTAAPNEIDKELLTPPTVWLAEPADFGIAAEAVEIAIHGEASMTGFWMPHSNGEKRTVVLFHDGDVNASATHPYWRFLHEAGFSVLAFDPRGFGRSKGTSTFRTWLLDLPHLFRWLRARSDVDPDRIALFGSGYGSLAAYWAARTQQCQALVIEHLPSLRAMLREAQGGGTGALDALGIGFTELAKLPEEIESEDVAERCQVPTLFVTADGEPARDRQSLLRTFAKHGGPKDLWLLTGTGQAPHGMLTYEGEYEARVAGFLQAALAGSTTTLRTEARKVADARSGNAIWEITVTPPAPVTARTAVEVCAVFADGTSHVANGWIDSGTARIRIELASAPLATTATLVPGAIEDPVAIWKRPRNARQLAATAIDASWSRIEKLRSGMLPPAEFAPLRKELTTAAAATPFPQDLEAELADVWALLGKELVASPDAQERAMGQALLQRATAAMPAKPALHVWHGPIATYGYHQEASVEMAKRLLAAPPK